MRNWAILFLIFGAIAGVLAFGGIGGVWTFVFLTVFVVMLIDGVALLVVGRRGRGSGRGIHA